MRPTAPEKSPWLRGVFFACLLFMQPFYLSAKGQPSKAKGNATEIKTLPEPDPQESEAAIDRHTPILRAKIELDWALTVTFWEKPTSTTVYNSSITVERNGATIATYPVGEMIQHQSLRLVHVALIRTGLAATLAAEYEGGAVGATEGFAILRYSATKVDLHTLPLTDFGKVVLYRSTPDRADIWSATQDYAGTIAETRYYSTRQCIWKVERYVCSLAKREHGRFSPGDVDDPGIEIRP